MKRQVNSKYGLYSKDRGLFAVQKSPLNGAKLDRLQDGRAERTDKIEIDRGCRMCGRHCRTIPWTYSRPQVGAGLRDDELRCANTKKHPCLGFGDPGRDVLCCFVLFGDLFWRLLGETVDEGREQQLVVCIEPTKILLNFLDDLIERTFGVEKLQWRNTGTVTKN